jgi:hypothetical protein
MSRILPAPLAAVLVIATSAAAAPPVTTGTLLQEMIDLQRLVETPDPAYHTVQFSSYDRRSQLPGGPGWFANSDGFGGEPTPNVQQVLMPPDDDGVGEYLICDVQGPGAIVRTWTAAHNGEYRVYLDGQDEPLYAGPAEAFLFCPYEALRQRAGVVINQALQHPFRQNMAGYCPIPFAQACRIVWRGKLRELHFYQIQVRRYAAGTAVTTFSPEDLETFRADLERVQQILNNPANAYPHRSDENTVPLAAQLEPGATVELATLAGPAAVKRLTLQARAQDRDAALRQTVLRIYCDQHEIPQVAAPLGDFFGAAPGVNPYDSLPFTVRPDGSMTCRYVMPFAQSLRLVLENQGAQPVAISGSVLPTDYDWQDGRSLHFRARWRVDHELVGDPAAIQDMPYLVAGGRGRFVGATLLLLNPTPVATPWGGWWGEGDEKIFVDDDTRPSTFGTGSEDYFNYAWSSPDIFVHAYCGQPRNDGPGNRGFVTNYRWQILDDLPFEHRFAFYMELRPHRRTPGMSYARIAYHYAAPGTVDDHVQITAADVRPQTLPANWQPVAEYALQGAQFHEAETVARSSGPLGRARDALWTGGELLTWEPAAPAETLDLQIVVPEDGEFTLHLLLALRPDAGRVRCTLDGTPLAFGGAAEQDLHVPHRVLARQFDSAPRQLSKGPHVLTLEFLGAPASVTTPVIGVDYVAVKPR